MVKAPSHGESLRTVADLMKDLMKENEADRAESCAVIDRLGQENATLRSRLDKNSKYSSKQPSSDSFRSGKRRPSQRT